MPEKVVGLRFGPAGIPNSTPRKTTVEGIKRVKELGLDAMELEFVRGVRMSEARAREVKELAKNLGVVLTAHAPYYINLCSDDESKVRASIDRILQSARIGFLAGAWSVVFHPGYYGKLSHDEAYRRVRKALQEIVEAVRRESIDVWIRPEVMGGVSEFGDLVEVVRLSAEMGPPVLPCVDFAHLHARHRGKYNSYDEFASVLELLEKELGKEVLKNMHIHVSGIEYGDKGEVKHLNLDESDFNYRELLRVLKDFGVEGVVISESPNLEEDALKMKRLWQELRTA